jgi:hypothetical protein
MRSISISEPSLSSRAMLSSLSISMWSARKHDPKASEEIATRHGAQVDVGRYLKILLPKKALADLKKVVSEVRQEHYFITLPWDDNGYRVLPASVYLDHTRKMHAHRQRFDSAVEDLCTQFESLVREARGRLGGLFCNEDYPATDELRGKFSFETKVRPLPDAGDFRVTLGDEEKQRIKRQITLDIEASLQVGARELWHRLYGAVQHMADRLAAYKVTKDGVEHPFRDTVVTNLVKLVDVLPKLNITKDPELERLSEQVRDSLLVDPKELRQSDSARIETANKAAEIASRMAGYMAACASPVFDCDHNHDTAKMVS